MKYKIIITLLFTIGAFVRLYNFENRLIFGPEQAISLINSAENLNKFSLLGEYNLQRTTSTGLNLIHGPLFSYFLLPFITFFNYRVLPVSLLFPLLNLITGLALYILVRKVFNSSIAFFSLFYFLFGSLMIYHSTFIWIYNLIPLLGVLTFWLVSKLIGNRTNYASVFWLGLISGIGFSLQYPYLIFALFIYTISVYLSNKKVISVFIYPFGFLVANITRVIFDLRHDFYHLRVLWEFFLDVYLRHTVTASTYYYHYLHLFPIFCIFISLITFGIYKLNKILAISLLAFYLVVNFQSPLLSFGRSTGMPNGITLKTLENVAQIINLDNPPEKFNVVTLWDFDTIARPMRYLLKYYYGRSAQPIENYAIVDAIYAFAPADYDITSPKVWELKTFMPYEVTSLYDTHSGYKLYKLTKSSEIN